MLTRWVGWPVTPGFSLQHGIFISSWRASTAVGAAKIPFCPKRWSEEFLSRDESVKNSTYALGWDTPSENKFLKRRVFFSPFCRSSRFHRNFDLVGSGKKLPRCSPIKPCPPYTQERKDQRVSAIHSRFDHEDVESMNNLPPPGSHIHLIAICGVGMASLAGLLQSRGYRVTGSDQNVYPPMSTYLQGVGIPILSGYRAAHLQPRPDLVVIGNAISRNNPEADAALSQGIPYISFPQALGLFLIQSRTSLVVAGTHGKTTTSALGCMGACTSGLGSGFFYRRCIAQLQ